MKWADQSLFSSILYGGRTLIAFEGRHIDSHDTTAYGGLTLCNRASTDPITETQQQARATYEGYDKRGRLCWRDTVLCWRAQILLGKEWKCLELGDATHNLEEEFARHKREVQGRLT